MTDSAAVSPLEADPRRAESRRAARTISARAWPADPVQRQPTRATVNAFATCDGAARRCRHQRRHGSRSPRTRNGHRDRRAVRDRQGARIPHLAPAHGLILRRSRSTTRHHTDVRKGRPPAQVFEEQIAFRGSGTSLAHQLSRSPRVRPPVGVEELGQVAADKRPGGSARSPSPRCRHGLRAKTFLAAGVARTGTPGPSTARCS